MGDWEVSAFAKDTDKAIKRAYERGQRIMRVELLKIISKRKIGKSKTARLALEDLWQEIAGMLLLIMPPKKAKSRKGAKKR